MDINLSVFWIMILCVCNICFAVKACKHWLTCFAVSRARFIVYRSDCKVSRKTRAICTSWWRTSQAVSSSPTCEQKANWHKSMQCKLLAISIEVKRRHLWLCKHAAIFHQVCRSTALSQQSHSWLWRLVAAQEVQTCLWVWQCDAYHTHLCSI